MEKATCVVCRAGGPCAAAGVAVLEQVVCMVAVPAGVGADMVLLVLGNAEQSVIALQHLLFVARTGRS